MGVMSTWLHVLFSLKDKGGSVHDYKCWEVGATTFVSAKNDSVTHFALHLSYSSYLSVTSNNKGTLVVTYFIWLVKCCCFLWNVLVCLLYFYRVYVLFCLVFGIMVFRFSISFICFINCVWVLYLRNHHYRHSCLFWCILCLQSCVSFMKQV